MFMTKIKISKYLSIDESEFLDFKENPTLEKAKELLKKIITGAYYGWNWDTNRELKYLTLSANYNKLSAVIFQVNGSPPKGTLVVLNPLSLEEEIYLERAEGLKQVLDYKQQRLFKLIHLLVKFMLEHERGEGK